MLKQQAKLMTRLIMAFDALVVGYAFFFSYSFRAALSQGMGPLHPFADYVPIILTVLPLWIIFSYFMGLYSSQRMKSPLTELYQIFKTGVVFFATLTVLAFILKWHFVSRFFIVFFVCGTTLYIAVAHFILRLVLRRFRRRGMNFRTIAIVGSNDAAAEMANIVHEHGEWGLKFIGYILPADAPADPHLLPCLGHVGELGAILRSNVVDEVIFAMPREQLDEMEDQLLLCEELGVSTKVMLNIFPHRISSAEVEEIGGVSMLSFSNTPSNLLALGFKRAFDVGMSAVALLLVSPIVIGTALAIKLTSRGPIFFAQERVGRNGRTFRLLKFRSMVADAESQRAHLEALNEMDGPVFKIKNDPRVTAVGRLIRRTSIDELPQFINVFVGDMSVVGPRPPIPSEVEKYKHWQRRRLSVKPGITCYWQISGRNKIDFESWMRLDLKYIDNWSLSEDFKIILRTIPVVLMGRGAS